MYRIINGFLCKGKPAQGVFKVSVRHLGHGHAEGSVRQAIAWEEVDAWAEISPEELAKEAARAAEDQEERDERNRERAARRAKTMCRHKIKAAGMDALLTLTYRENQTDLVLAKKHMYEFVRRMRRALPAFQYVAAFEQQKRGAWHVHLATHRLPAHLAARNGIKVKSFNVVRAIWRDVVGELGGNIDQAARKRWSKQSAGKLAAYLSKYLLKAFEDGDKWDNRYTCSKGLHVPKATVMEFRAANMGELIDLVFGEIAQGRCECMTWLSGFGDCFFLSTEKPPPR